MSEETRAVTRAPEAGRFDADDLPPGTEVGSFTLSDRIGAGGFGAVYAAVHRVIGKRAAVKIIHAALSSHSESVTRFIREAQLVNAIRHPNIVDIFEMGMLDDGRAYLVMELVEGGALAAHVATRGRFSPSAAAFTVERLANALDACHAAGIVHRDVKPQNVLLTNRPEGPWPTLIDFGIGKLFEHTESAITTVGRTLGSPVSMAPEQIRGERVGPGVDIYALGVVFHYMLTGRYPFVAATPAELHTLHLTAPVPSLLTSVKVPALWDDALKRAMAKSAADRFTSAGDFARALGAPPPSATSTWRGAARAKLHTTEMAPGDDQGSGIDDALDVLIAEATDSGYAIGLRTSDELIVVPTSRSLPLSVLTDRARAALNRAGLEHVGLSLVPAE